MVLLSLKHIHLALDALETLECIQMEFFSVLYLKTTVGFTHSLRPTCVNRDEIEGVAVED